MLGRNLGLTISCALGASAFLLPPGASVASTDKDVLPFVAIDPKNQVLELPCSSCAFPTVKSEEIESADAESMYFAQGGANNLLLNFTISEDGQALLLNNEQLYPLDYAIDDIADLKWTVQQISASTSREQLESGEVQGTPLRITGHVYSTSPAMPLTPDGDSVISIRWQLLTLEHEMMTVDEVLVQLLQTAEGELLILSADATPSPDSMPFGLPFLKPIDAPERPSKGCKYLPGPLCDMGNFIESKVNGKRPGCGGKKFDSFNGRMPGHIRPHFGSDEKHGSHGRPHDGHRGHHHHHRHSIFHAISRGILAIMIPVIAGITVGMAVSVLGLLTGRFIGWLWFTVIRGGKRGYSRVASDDIVITVTDMDKKESEKHFEALPRYEDAPAYEETEKEVL